MNEWIPNAQSLLDGSTARYVDDSSIEGHSIIENEDGDVFLWANDEFIHLDMKE